MDANAKEVRAGATGRAIDMKTSKRYLPGPVYHALPWCYVACGAFLLIVFDAMPLRFSGLVLAAAGVLVLMWRGVGRGARRRQALRTERRAEAARRLGGTPGDQGHWR